MAELVESGGRLLLFVRSDHVHLPALERWLSAFDFYLHLPSEAAESSREHAFDLSGSLDRVAVPGADRVPLPSDRLRLFGAGCGNGAVSVLWDSEWLTRKRMGHVFDLPDEASRAVYDSWFETIRVALRPGPIDRRTYDILEEASR
ncbi:MAG TPA: hypothetical protein VMS76_10280 [Planctomycetota bacterium]|nr:hypothetical protein [Planctomycetota bacterium]